MKAHSINLRKKILYAVYVKSTNVEDIAINFKVSSSFIHKLIKLWEETGKFGPLPSTHRSHPPGPSSLIDNSDYSFLKKLINDDPNITLNSLCGKIQSYNGIKVSVSTMHRTLLKLKLTKHQRVKTLIR